MEKLTYIKKNIWKTILLLGTVSIIYGRCPYESDEKLHNYRKNNENNNVSTVFISEGTILSNENLINIKEAVSPDKQLEKQYDQILFIQDGTIISNVKDITICGNGKKKPKAKKQEFSSVAFAKRAPQTLKKAIQKSTKSNFLITKHSILSNRLASYGEFCGLSQNNDYTKQLVTVDGEGLFLLTLYYQETLSSDKTPNLILSNISNNFSIRPPPLFTFHRDKYTNSYI